MGEEILKLENNFFDINYIKNEEYLKNVIHEDFSEVGKSGKIFNKFDIISFLLKYEENRNIEIINYVCNKIDKNTYLVHYETNENNKHIFRTSIWKMENNLKLLFHQATELNNVEFID